MNFGYIFGNISKTRNMVKRPGLGKRKRVTLSQMESSDQPEQPEQAEQSDEFPDTQASDPRGSSHPGNTARGHRGVGGAHPWKVQEEASEDDRCPGG